MSVPLDEKALEALTYSLNIQIFDHVTAGKPPSSLRYDQVSIIVVFKSGRGGITLSHMDAVSCCEYEKCVCAMKLEFQFLSK